MSYSFRKTWGLLRMLNSVAYDLIAPPNLTVMWNFGSLLGVCLVNQIISGLLLACHYTADVEHAFDSVCHIMRDVNNGWFVRSMHVNGASFFFGCVYAHIGRGIFYHSYCLKHTWLVGCNIFILLMAIAFTGYVLPWGQMSFWGATVITNLFSVIPYVGTMLVEWMWGGFSVGNSTLKRFFVFHFIFPFVLVLLVVVHIIYLHETGSSNPLGMNSDAEGVPFHSYYTLKDLVGILLMLWFLVLICLFYPDVFSDPVNFIPADPMSTPLHIQPEWYFLFAYSILRSIPNKSGGVAALAFSVAVLYIMPFYPKGLVKGSQFNPLAQFIFWWFVGIFILLTFIGSCPIEPPFMTMGLTSSILYFFFFAIYPWISIFWDSVLEQVVLMAKAQR
uniref:cytochrome b n=1 Tax=Polymesoda caroliniana TaxID=98308 RepID=UPI002A83ACDD|nr:cytochrome b [Polymesoda caroliniana]WOV69032.1 cytochrome b [Polymesoda caroliniana]